MTFVDNVTRTAPARFSAPSVAAKLAAILGDDRPDLRFYCDCDGNGTQGDPDARAYGYVWVTASNGHRALVWLDVATRHGVMFAVSRKRPAIVAPRGITMAQIAAFITAELDRENIGAPTAVYVPRDRLGAYTADSVTSGAVRVIEDQEPAARDALLAAWQDGRGAYPLGYAVKVKDGFITGGIGSV